MPVLSAKADTAKTYGLRLRSRPELRPDVAQALMMLCDRGKTGLGDAGLCIECRIHSGPASARR